MSHPRLGDDAPNDHPASAGQLLVDPVAEPELAALLDRTSEALSERSDDLTMQRHLRAMQRQGQRSPRWSQVRLAGAAVAVVFAVTATLAGLGALPAPAQQVAGEVADRVGITLPQPALDRSQGAPSDTVLKQLPTFEVPPGHADRSSQGRSDGFPKSGEVSNELPGPGSRPDEVPGAREEGDEGSRQDEAPGLEQAPGQDVAPGLQHRDDAPNVAPSERNRTGHDEDPQPDAAVERTGPQTTPPGRLAGADPSSNGHGAPVSGDRGTS